MFQHQFASPATLRTDDRDLSRAAAERYSLVQAALDRRREAAETATEPAVRRRRFRFRFAARAQA